MYILSDIFQIYVNQTMTCKILNIDAEIFNTMKQELLLKCYQIQVPSILECSVNIKKQFYLVIYPLDIELNRISIYLCKKKYDFSQEFFLPKKGLCKKNFVLDFTIDEPENKNWKEIQDNKILFYFQIIIVRLYSFFLIVVIYNYHEYLTHILTFLRQIENSNLVNVIQSNALAECGSRE